MKPEFSPYTREKCFFFFIWLCTYKKQKWPLPAKTTILNVGIAQISYNAKPPHIPLLASLTIISLIGFLLTFCFLSKIVKDNGTSSRRGLRSSSSSSFYVTGVPPPSPRAYHKYESLLFLSTFFEFQKRLDSLSSHPHTLFSYAMLSLYFLILDADESRRVYGHGRWCSEDKYYKEKIVIIVCTKLRNLDLQHLLS